MTAPKADPFALTGIKKVRVSPLDAPAWRYLRISLLSVVTAWLLHVSIGAEFALGAGLIAAALLTAWGAAVRLLFLEIKGRVFWLVWLAGGLLFPLLSGPSGGAWAGGTVFSFIFLAFRRFRPLSRLSHRHRSRTFFLGLLAVSLLSWGWFIGRGGAFAWNGALAGWFQNFIRYSLGCLQVFWVFALLHIFFKTRLHSTHIRPKLAVSTALIAVVPLLLVVFMGLAVIFSVLGEVQAARAARVLESWSELSGRDPAFCRNLSREWFLFEAGAGGGKTEGAPPPWLGDFLKVAVPAAAKTVAAKPSTASDFYWVGKEAWLLKAGAPEAGKTKVWGCRLDEEFMNRLARIVHADVRITATSPVRVGRTGGSLSVGIENMSESDISVVGRYDPAAPPFRTWFGMTHLDVRAFSGNRAGEAAFLISLKTSLRSIRDEVYSSKNPLSQVVMGGLIAAAILLLILEAFALFFGLRIATGITSAVRTLHAGTKRIAAGDLDTPIEIPNEDELGDLAASLNEMSAAVKRGKEEALHRERLERDLSVAREIQEQLLPHKMPALPGFEISGVSLPSQQVGGDYFDFLDMPEGRLGIAIADVSGKGIPAALLMANLQAMLHGQAEGEPDPAPVVARINNFLVRSTDPRMFATFFYGILDRQKATFAAVNAGHNPPFVLRAADGRLERIEPSGLILGFLSDQVYRTDEIALAPGDVVLLFTDGITEAFDPALLRDPDRFFGEERLIRTLRESAGSSAAEIQAAVLKAVAVHTSHAGQNDDITIVVIKRRTETA